MSACGFQSCVVVDSNLMSAILCGRGNPNLVRVCGIPILWGCFSIQSCEMCGIHLWGCDIPILWECGIAFILWRCVAFHNCKDAWHSNLMRVCGVPCGGVWHSNLWRHSNLECVWHSNLVSVCGIPILWACVAFKSYEHSNLMRVCGFQSGVGVWIPIQWGCVAFQSCQGAAFRFVSVWCIPILWGFACAWAEKLTHFPFIAPNCIQ
jgi:hypothetical protein